ncbi:MAG TPA: DoxX family protein, partial [Flavobacterium sp.]|nr:DoxX family protein [Flavobacterium sp.]
MKIIKTVLCVLFALMFVNSGLNKFFNYMPMPELKPEDLKIYEAFGTIRWLMPLVGLIEILGGLLF